MKTIYPARSGLLAGAFLLASTIASFGAKPIAQDDSQGEILRLMGAQAGHIADETPTGCYIGTIGSMVFDTATGTNYLLSNNHVFARENNVTGDDRILHVAAYLCDPNALHVGDLSAFVEIQFNGSGNLVDAALAQITTVVVPEVNNATDKLVGHMADNGQVAYYASKDTVAATLGLAVQKTGRTTGLTEGVVSSTDAIVNVRYDGGVATFVDQIVFTGSKGSFSDSGDSGSLIVTNTGASVESPVALLFAGSRTTTIGSPIDTVLEQLAAQIGAGATLQFGYSGVDFTITPDNPGGDGDGGDGGDPTGPGKGNGNGGGKKPKSGFETANPGLARALAVRDRNEARIRSIAGVEGTGIGLAKDGSGPVIRIFTSVNPAIVQGRLPGNLEGIRFEIIETGKFYAY